MKRLASPPSRTPIRRVIAASSLSLLVTLSASTCRGQEVTGEQVRDSLARATRWMLSAQLAGGGWPEFRQDGGTTALATLALLNAGRQADDPAMRRAIAAVRAIQLHQTYVVSLKIQALVAADPVRHLPDIRAAAEWLVRTMHTNGMWGYGNIPGHTDFSNSQFAMLGLHEAARVGAPVPEALWRRAEQALVQAQETDGSWSYVPELTRSTGSMTAAGVASLYISGNSLVTRSESGFTNDGEAPRCGRYSEFRPIARGLAWLAKNFSVMRNPGDTTWYYYYMYGIERVGILAGVRYLGRNDWYRQGAAALVARQHPDGHWEEIDDVVDTSFSILFLSKGHRPVLAQKLKWSDDNRWNPDRNDLAHLISFIGARMGGPFSWETISVEADLKDWHTAPILYFQGHDFPVFREGDVEKLRQYVAGGGTILAEACCGKKDFRARFGPFIKLAFPDFELHRLAPEHPVFRSLYKLDGAGIELHGVDVGCRTSIFYSPNDLSCLWEQGNIPGKSEAAFKLGANIAAYATGLEPLPDKLDEVRVVRPRAVEASADAARGAVYIAQLIHNGDWRPDPHAIANLAEELHATRGTDVVNQGIPLKATDPKLAEHPIVYMTGHFSFKLGPEETAALRKHIERGGFLFADACCGRKAFDDSFRQFAAQLFPQHPLQRLPANHPIIIGAPGVALPAVSYKPALQTEQPGLREVVLEGITLDARTAVVYSPYSIGCGLDGHACFACRGLLAPDARRLGANIVLYALSY